MFAYINQTANIGVHALCLYVKVYVCANKRDEAELAFKRADLLHLSRCPTKCAIEDLDHALQARTQKVLSEGVQLWQRFF